MKKRKNLGKKVFERDNYTCQKCKIQDKTARILEAHHTIPLYLSGSDELDNLMTLCSDCHHFAPNDKKEFLEYIEEEMDGTATTLMKAFKKVREEHPELFDKFDKKEKP
jgi:predicted restriction endonuclease